MKRTERISYYEGLLDSIADVLLELDEALLDFKIVQPSIKKLERYYTSKQWKEDFAADEAGKLPADLKRGVLSEDYVYNILEEVGELKKKMKKLL